MHWARQASAHLLFSPGFFCHRAENGASKTCGLTAVVELDKDGLLVHVPQSTPSPVPYVFQTGQPSLQEPWSALT